MATAGQSKLPHVRDGWDYAADHRTAPGHGAAPGLRGTLRAGHLAGRDDSPGVFAQGQQQGQHFGAYPEGPQEGHQRPQLRELCGSLRDLWREGHSCRDGVHAQR